MVCLHPVRARNVVEYHMATRAGVARSGNDAFTYPGCILTRIKSNMTSLTAFNHEWLHPLSNQTRATKRHAENTQ